jgi:hypothetical protein
MKLIKEIRSKEGKLHFRRWQLLKTRWFSIYIHGIYEADQDKHLHNHPWDYKSIVLKGSYIEETQTGLNNLKPGTYTSRNGKDYHKIKKLLTNSVYTLFIVTPVKREWGYLVDNYWMHHEVYREKKNKGLI